MPTNEIIEDNTICGCGEPRQYEPKSWCFMLPFFGECHIILTETVDKSCPVQCVACEMPEPPAHYRPDTYCWEDMKNAYNEGMRDAR